MNKIFIIIISLFFVVSSHAGLFGIDWEDNEMCTAFTGSFCDGQEIMHIYWRGYDSDGRRLRCRQMASQGLCKLSDYNMWKNEHNSSHWDREGFLWERPYTRMLSNDGVSLLMMKGVVGSVCFSDSDSNDDDEYVGPLGGTGMPCGESPSTAGQTPCPNGLTRDALGQCMPAQFTDDKCLEDPFKYQMELDGLIAQTELFDSGTQGDPFGNSSSGTGSSSGNPWLDGNGNPISGSGTGNDNSFQYDQISVAGGNGGPGANANLITDNSNSLGSLSGGTNPSFSGNSAGLMGLGGVGAKSGAAGAGGAGSKGGTAGGVSVGGVSASAGTAGSNTSFGQSAGVIAGSDSAGKMVSGGGGGAGGFGGNSGGKSGAAPGGDSNKMVDSMLAMIGFGSGGKDPSKEAGSTAIGFGKSDEFDANGNRIKGNGSSDLLNIQDPSDYFTRVNLDDNIFKVVEKRYRKTQSDWVLKRGP